MSLPLAVELFSSILFGKCFLFSFGCYSKSQNNALCYNIAHIKVGSKMSFPTGNLAAFRTVFVSYRFEGSRISQTA